MTDKGTQTKRLISKRTKVYIKHKTDEGVKEKSKVIFLIHGIQTWEVRRMTGVHEKTP